MKIFILLICIINLVFSCPDIKLIDGGISGEGAFRTFWDCCKPDCSSTAYVGKGNEARQCDKLMNFIEDYSAKSKCEGGPATTCLSQIPFTIDGCDNIGFAFASVQSPNKNLCGKCFLLENRDFSSTLKKGHNLLTKKKTIVMVLNIDREDTNPFKFQLMVPGGGNRMLSNEFHDPDYPIIHCNDVFGNKYATINGIVGICEKEVGGGDDDTIYTKMKECIFKKCSDLGGDAFKGCLFHSNFLEGVNIGHTNYKEIECPSELKDLY